MLRRALARLTAPTVRATQPIGSIILKPVEIGTPVIWSRLQFLYWRYPPSSVIVDTKGAFDEFSAIHHF